MRKTVDIMKHNMFISIFAIQSDLQPCENTAQASWEPPKESIHFGVPHEGISGNGGSKNKAFQYSLHI